MMKASTRPPSPHGNENNKITENKLTKNSSMVDRNPLVHDQYAPYLARKLAKQKIVQKPSSKRVPTIKEMPETFLTSSPITQPQTEANSPFRTPALSPRNDGIISDQFKQHLEMEKIFDHIASGCYEKPLHTLTENGLKQFFNAEEVYFFHDVPSIQSLYAPTITLSCPHGSGIVGFCHFSRKIVMLDSAQSSVSYNVIYDLKTARPDSKVLAFPIFDRQKCVRAVIEIVRNASQPSFGLEEQNAVEYFQNKCALFARVLFQANVTDQDLADLSKTARMEDFIPNLQTKMLKLFACKQFEVYRMKNGQITKYEEKPRNIPNNESGIPGYVLINKSTVSCPNANTHSAYHPNADGAGDESCLVVPYREKDCVFAVALRGKRLPHFFTDQDERLLSRVIPVVVSALNSCIYIEDGYCKLDEALKAQKRLQSLLKIASALSGTLDLDHLVQNILTKACELMHADRCSLFMVAPGREKLVTNFQRGLETAIEVPMGTGIVGHTAVTGKMLNIRDAYEDPRFNRDTDRQTGYRTTSILSAPLFSNSGEVVGVTEMINKDGGVFTKEDEELISAFNVFTAISIANAQLYSASLTLSMQLKAVLDMSQQIASGDQVVHVVTLILTAARQVLKAGFSAIYTGPQLTELALDEDDESHHERENRKLQKKDYLKKMMSDRSSSSMTPTDNQVAKAALGGESQLTEEYIAAPIRNTRSKVQRVKGVVLIGYKREGNFTQSDVEMLEAFSVFISLALDKSYEIAHQGLTEIEKSQCDIPTRFITPSAVDDGFASVAYLFENITGPLKITNGALSRFIDIAVGSSREFRRATESMQFASRILRGSESAATKTFVIYSSLLFSNACILYDGVSKETNISEPDYRMTAILCAVRESKILDNATEDDKSGILKMITDWIGSTCLSIKQEGVNTNEELIIRSSCLSRLTSTEATYQAEREYLKRFRLLDVDSAVQSCYSSLELLSKKYHNALAPLENLKKFL